SALSRHGSLGRGRSPSKDCFVRGSRQCSGRVVIKDLDDTLRELLVKKMPAPPESVAIKFEMPAPEWSAGVSLPTINLFLFDVRENHELRSSQRTVVRTDAAHASERRAPIKMDMSYLITAWAADVADEHQLLGQLLLTLFRYPILPQDV